MAEDARIEELAKIKRQEEANNARVIRLEEQLNAAKKRMLAVANEITSLGYDPKTFEQEVIKLDAKFTEDLAKYRTEVQEQSEKISEIEAQL